MKNTLSFMHGFIKVKRWTSHKKNLPNANRQNLLFLLFRFSKVRHMSSWTFDPGLTGHFIRRYTMGNCMLLSWTEYARSKNETIQKLMNKENKANQNKSSAKMRARTKSLLLTRPEPSPEQLQCYFCLFVLSFVSSRLLLKKTVLLES